MHCKWHHKVKISPFAIANTQTTNLSISIRYISNPSATTTDGLMNNARRKFSCCLDQSSFIYQDELATIPSCSIATTTKNNLPTCFTISKTNLSTTTSDALNEICRCKISAGGNCAIFVVESDIAAITSGTVGTKGDGSTRSSNSTTTCANRLRNNTNAVVTGGYDCSIFIGNNDITS